MHQASILEVEDERIVALEAEDRLLQPGCRVLATVRTIAPVHEASYQSGDLTRVELLTSTLERASPWSLGGRVSP